MFMEENIFSRCTYDYFQKGMPAPEKRVYILRVGKYGHPDEAMWEQADHWECECPDGFDWRVTKTGRDETFRVKMIEYISPDGEIVTRVSNFQADKETYTMEYLLEHPDLLPDGDTESFLAAYAHYDKAKAGGSSSEWSR